MTDKDGYALETTEGTSVITGAGDTTYKFGQMATRNDWPSPEMVISDIGVGVGTVEVAAGDMFVQLAECSGALTFGMQNGVPLLLALGSSSTVGAGPYTHTISPTRALPSFTVQHEEDSPYPTEEFQFPGCMVDSLTLTHKLDSSFLIAKMAIMSQKPTDPGFALTNDPALPSTANSAPYLTLTRTWDYGSGNLALAGLQRVDITISNGLMPLYGTRHDAGTPLTMWPYMHLPNRRKQYEVTLDFTPMTVGRDMWDAMIAKTLTKDLYFKWTRSADDYIAITLSDCGIKRHTITTDPDALKVISATLVPRAISVEVKDSIAGGAYNE